MHKFMDKEIFISLDIFRVSAILKNNYAWFEIGICRNVDVLCIYAFSNFLLCPEQ